jgi:hypothetical protein
MGERDIYPALFVITDLAKVLKNQKPANGDMPAYDAIPYANHQSFFT